MSRKKVVARKINTGELVAIWLDGFSSGVASTSKFLLGYSDQEADRISGKLSGHLIGDPVAMEQVRAEVRERLQGIDSGSRNLMVYDANGPVTPGCDE